MNNYSFLKLKLVCACYTAEKEHLKNALEDGEFNMIRQQRVVQSAYSEGLEVTVVISKCTDE